MKMFVPWSDEWDSGLPFKGAVLVPYRCGLPVWREPPIVESAPIQPGEIEPIATAA